jgi:hypothetical protein
VVSSPRTGSAITSSRLRGAYAANWRLRAQFVATRRRLVGERRSSDWRIRIMSGTTDQFEGGCLCGAVRLTATGQPKGVYWCHCQSCRKHSGAPASVFVAFDRSSYSITKGEITKFDSTPGRTTRGFCARCGSTLTCESARLPTETHFYLGAFDRAAELQPTRHVFAEEHLPWVPVDK